jgi:hypothetical protein
MTAGDRVAVPTLSQSARKDGARPFGFAQGWLWGTHVRVPGMFKGGPTLVGFARTLRLRSGQANSVRAGSFDWAQDRLFDSAALRSG